MNSLNDVTLQNNSFLKSTTIFDYDSEVFTNYFHHHIRGDNLTVLDKLINFYYVVRDKIHYQIFDIDVSITGLKASTVITNSKGFCLHKSIVFITAARMLQFPARLKAVHVRNHLASPDIIRLMGGEVFLHWYAEIKINGTWIKATPVFSKIFCQLYGSIPLEFNGKTDSVYQIYDKDKSSALLFIDTPITIEPKSAEELIKRVITSHPNLLNKKHIVHSNYCLP